MGEKTIILVDNEHNTEIELPLVEPSEGQQRREDILEYAAAETGNELKRLADTLGDTGGESPGAVRGRCDAALDTVDDSEDGRAGDGGAAAAVGAR